jgi:hypothetical protein
MGITLAYWMEHKEGGPPVVPRVQYTYAQHDRTRRGRLTPVQDTVEIRSRRLLDTPNASISEHQRRPAHMTRCPAALTANRSWRGRREEHTEDVRHHPAPRGTRMVTAPEIPKPAFTINLRAGQRAGECRMAVATRRTYLPAYSGCQPAYMARHAGVEDATTNLGSYLPADSKRQTAPVPSRVRIKSRSEGTYNYGEVPVSQQQLPTTSGQSHPDHTKPAEKQHSTTRARR